MRVLSLFVFILFLAFAAPVFAGSASYADMHGKWQPTGCTIPQPPTLSMVHDPEKPADDLNALTVAHNQFVAASEAYMICIRNEAQRDNEALGVLVTRSAQTLIDKQQAAVNASAQNVHSKPADK